MTRLGVCYYPEHWPEDIWARDAERMAALGLSVVRIGEFAWSRLEPDPGRYEFDWLELAINTLANAGLSVVLGTPTATPPKWLVDQMPDMLPVDANGQARGFGSRRHYCFSHLGYRAECARIVTELAKRFGNHPAITTWQTDNEHGCHDTVLSWSDAARDGFRAWLSQKYQSPDVLNRAWGNVFWSMEYREFDEIDLPNAVTEVNPAHMMDFQRYSSDQVTSFNGSQATIIRRYSPGRDIIHNFMGRTTSFDHFDVCEDLDIASWDSYPLGFLEDRSDCDDAWRQKFFRSGDPDFQAFHHDLYRAAGRGRWWVMEQQPGPVNWAPHNPAPRDGMVRLWSLEAFAHGAEVVSYFRWRQAPFAQEQMHSGLLLPNGEEARGFTEAQAVNADLKTLGDLPAAGRADVAVLFDYPSAWAWDIQPQGMEFDYFSLVFDFYKALRQLGLSVDILPADAPDIDGYKLLLIPGLFTWNEALLNSLNTFDGIVLAGPRSGSKTSDFQIPKAMPPALPKALLDVEITIVESLRHDCPRPLQGGGAFKYWVEHAMLGGAAETVRLCEDGRPALVRQNGFFYLAGWPDDDLMREIIGDAVASAGLETTPLPDGVRMRQLGGLTFVFNYGEEAINLETLGLVADATFILGSQHLEPSGVSVFRV